MSRCFVIQPFDSDEFDKRYNDILKPTIEEMGLEAYRVDNDPTVTSIITAIENGIREADVCLADISTNNPNVWLELGYARAASRSIVMICSRKHRDKLPFDIQDNAVVFYDSDSPSDFESLKSEISRRILAGQKQISKPLQSNERKDTSRLQQRKLNRIEMLLLSIIAEGSEEVGGGITPYSLSSHARQRHLIPIEIGMSHSKLMRDGIIEESKEIDRQSGESYNIIRITELGWKCIEDDQILSNDDDIPF